VRRSPPALEAARELARSSLPAMDARYFLTGNSIAQQLTPARLKITSAARASADPSG
jgi:hypothetical protein